MLDIDLSKYNPANVDTLTESGGMLAPGKYHVRLDGAKDATSRNGLPGKELIFTVLAGPFAGQEIKETLWDSDKEAARNRVIRFGHRLGLYKVFGGHYVSVEGKSDFADCLGAEVVVEVHQETYKREDGKEGKSCRVTFGGIWSLDEKGAKDAPKGKAGATPAAKPKPKVDTSTL